MYISRPGLFFSALLLTLGASAMQASSQDYPAPICRIEIYEDQSALEDAKTAVDQAKLNFEAYDKIFSMIKGLWEAKTMADMDYIKAKYDRDASKLKLERNDLVLDRQTALVEQYRLICKATESKMGAPEKANAIWKEYLRYRRADCDALAKSIEISATNIEYYREYLKKIVKLRDEKFATDSQVILAGLDLELEQKNLVDAKRRTATCRSEMSVLTAGGSAANSAP
jgi:hypothetical protein